MTVPLDVILPLRAEFDTGEEYEKVYNDTLKSYLDEIVKATYGSYLTNFELDQEQWIPEVFGATSAGAADTYDRQVGWVLRRSLLVDVWFDVEWSVAHTGTGILYVQLPYIVANTDGLPYVGTIQSSTVTYAGFDGLVCNAQSNSYRLEIWKTGTGAATAGLAVPAAGRLIGHVRYIGQDDEITDS